MNICIILNCSKHTLCGRVRVGVCFIYLEITELKLLQLHVEEPVGFVKCCPQLRNELKLAERVNDNPNTAATFSLKYVG